MRTMATNEAGLIARILAGEKELFHELIRPYERMVYLKLFAIVKNEAEAEDGAQEAVIKAYRYLASFRGEAKFSTWLTTIAINEGRKRLRKSKGASEDYIEGLGRTEHRRNGASARNKSWGRESAATPRADDAAKTPGTLPENDGSGTQRV